MKNLSLLPQKKLLQLKHNAKLLGLVDTKPPKKTLQPWEVRNQAYAKNLGKSRLVLICVLLKPSAQTDEEIARPMVDATKVSFDHKIFNYFRSTFAEPNLNMAALSPEATAWYTTQLLTNGNVEHCLEDITTLTLQHLVKTCNEEAVKQAAQLGLDWMKEYCKTRWRGEGAKCGINYIETSKEANAAL